MHPRSRPPVGKTGVIACGKKIKSLTLGIIEIPTGKTMKRLIGNIRLTVLVIVLLSAFNMGATAKDKMVERGMDKKEVRAILGKPRGTSFDQYGETWTYAKGALIGDFYKMITVHFDLSGKVVTYQEQFYDMSKRDSAPIGSTMQQPAGPGYSCPPFPSGPHYALSDPDFTFLLDKVRSASFDKGKYSLLEVASLGCCYTCAQCARMMELFDFDEYKLKVLKIMVPRIVDAQNAYVIYKVFTFDSGKEKAAQIMAGK